MCKTIVAIVFRWLLTRRGETLFLSLVFLRVFAPLRRAFVVLSQIFEFVTVAHNPSSAGKGAGNQFQRHE